MPEEVLRMRATVSSEEALNNIRQIGRAFGILPQQAKPALDSVSQSATNLTNVMRRLVVELRGAVPALGGFGLGAAGVGAGVYALVRTLSTVSEKIVQLKHRSAELGIAENALRGFSQAAQNAGIAPDAFNASLARFKRNTDDFKLRIGGVREELIRMGAGPVVQRMNAAVTTVDKLKVAFDFKQTLDKLDPSGDRGRRFFEDIGLGAEAARLSFEELAKSVKAPLTQKQKEDAEAFHKAIVALGFAWDDFVMKTGQQLFPGPAESIKSLSELLDLLGKANDLLDKFTGRGLLTWLTNPFSPGAGIGEMIAPTPGRGSVPRVTPRATPQGFTPQGTNPLLAPATGTTGGYQPIAFSDGFRGGGTDLSEGSRMVKEGVFAALVDFQSYVTGGAGPGGSQGAGMQRVAFGGISGGWSSGGGASGPSGGGGAGAAPMGGGATAGATGSALTDQSGKGVDMGTVSDLSKLAAQGNTSGMRQLMQQRGYRVDSKWCGDLARVMVGGSGFSVPKGYAIGSQWRAWGEHAEPSDINAPDRPMGSMVASKTNVPIGQTGGHVMTVVPGTYDAKTGTAEVIDTGGRRRRSLRGFEVRYAGAEAVAQAEAKRRGNGPSGASVGGMDKGAYDKMFAGTPLEGQYDKVVEAAKANNISPSMMAAVMAHETGGGKSKMLRDRLNPAGLMDPKTGWKTGQRFDTIEEGIDKAAATIAKNYARGGGTLAGMAKTYAPVGAANDPRGLNRGWAAGVASYQSRLDAANAPTMNATGSVNVNITSNGTAARAEAKSDGIFQQSKITNYNQMAPTDPQSSMVGAP